MARRRWRPSEGGWHRPRSRFPSLTFWLESRLPGSADLEPPETVEASIELTLHRPPFELPEI
ncbi:MAG: hypothetical protein MI919_17285 [Holophagales bacterium]|nr:hypothetical protein [Holophagales bacterium]